MGAAFGALDLGQEFLPGFFVVGEYRAKENFGLGHLGVGLIAGTMTKRFNSVENGLETIGTVRNKFAALRAAWYPEALGGNRFQAYLSLNLGVRFNYRVGTFSGISEDKDALQIGHGYSAGLHFKFNEQLGMYVDLGYGLSNLGVGLYFNIDKVYKTMSSTSDR